MKVSLLTYIFIVLILGGCKGGSDNKAGEISPADTGTAVLLFDVYEYNFGKVEEGKEVSHRFNYENKGTGPLVINSVSTTCGCTVPKYSTRPLKPGEKGSLEVVFDTSDRSGVQTKTISVKSNATVPVVLLRITADVQKE